MLKQLKYLFCRPCETKGGKFLPPRTDSISEYYAKKDSINRWQGDVYNFSNFGTGSFPVQSTVPYWMLLNRTCHLVEEGNRIIKLPFLNFAAVYDLTKYLTKPTSKSASIKNQISKIIKESEGILFLPENEAEGIELPLVANFNIVHSVKLDNCPVASNKILQLSSPFCEHSFQKFANYFYTVGFDDKIIKSSKYIDEMTAKMELHFNQ